MTPTTNTLPEVMLLRLKREIKRLGRQDAIAKELKIHRVTLNRYLSGKLDIPLSVLLQLLNALNMRLSDFDDGSADSSTLDWFVSYASDEVAAKSNVFEEGFTYRIYAFYKDENSLNFSLEGTSEELLVEDILPKENENWVFPSLESAKDFCEKLEMGWRENAYNH